MKKTFALLLLCGIAVGGGVFVNLPEVELSIGSFVDQFASKTEAEEPSVIKTKIRFVGDVMLGRNVEFLMKKYGGAYTTESLDTHPKDAYLVGNFESAIPAVHVPTKSMTFTFSVDPQYLENLHAYGFTHFGLANNHAYDHGQSGFDSTVETLRDASFEVFGDQKHEFASSSVAFIEVEGKMVALVGVYAVYTRPTDAELEEVFAYAKKRSYAQIAYVHWGEEYEPTHSKAQRALAEALVEAGADIVIGHHPHVIQDIELYKDAPIIYSLGNFIFDQYFSEEVQVGLMAELSFSRSALDLNLIPVTSIGSRSQPRMASPLESDELLEVIAKKSDTELEEMIKNGVITVNFGQQ
jgi:gamma-polyglutamate biosynthesis protein CapA